MFDSKQVNAFALPGGKIGVYTGLLEVATNQDQLATVIGHEISHVLAQHSNERLSRSQLANVGLQLSSVAISGTDYHDAAMAGLGLGGAIWCADALWPGPGIRIRHRWIALNGRSGI